MVLTPRECSSTRSECLRASVGFPHRNTSSDLELVGRCDRDIYLQRQSPLTYYIHTRTYYTHTFIHTLTFPDIQGVVTGCQSSFRHSGLRRCLSPVRVTFLVRSGFPPATSTCEQKGRRSKTTIKGTAEHGKRVAACGQKARTMSTPCWGSVSVLQPVSGTRFA